ncbi:MAG: peptide-methionine (S)-S-oxide reductase MsrA [Verrucomicrobia bacterium]|nr:peptide-methionine (S)-S-oxide reductase MsrA [Verrucomicrobiota bacterium]
MFTLAWAVSCAPPKSESDDKATDKSEKGDTEKVTPAEQVNAADSKNPDQAEDPKNAGHVVLGGGCFWCVEEVLHQLDGVTAVISGYAGGTPADANYEAVCGGKTDHAEVVKVTFDRDKVSLDKVLDAFWKLHDPTTVNRQGNDRGRQYRSVIFYEGDEQKEIATASKKKIGEAEVYPTAIVTLIVPLDKFYPAEDNHQNYARIHPNDLYIRQVLFPKLKKLHLKLPE